eukprot:2851582-Lingulodinium_polyedra.AAC.1
MGKWLGCRTDLQVAYSWARDFLQAITEMIETPWSDLECASLDWGACVCKFEILRKLQLSGTMCL